MTRKREEMIEDLKNQVMKEEVDKSIDYTIDGHAFTIWNSDEVTVTARVIRKGIDQVYRGYLITEVNPNLILTSMITAQQPVTLLPKKHSSLIMICSYNE